jgi:UDP-glucose 4-epimerase
VAELARRGHEVRALARPSSASTASGGRTPGGRPRRPDGARGPGDAFAGIDVLIHLAAALTGTPAEQHAVTVGDRTPAGRHGRVLDPQARGLSSLSVYDWSATRACSTSLPLEQRPGRRGGYAAAKIEQERLVRRRAAERGWDLTVLRPGFIWGRDHAYLPCLGVRAGPLHLVIGPGSRLPLTHVENCASMCAEAAENPPRRRPDLNVIDDDESRAWGYLGEHLRRSGQGGVRVPVPYGLALAGSRFADATLGRVVRRLPGLLVPDQFRARFKPLRFSDRKAREVLGWRPPLGREECLRRTYDPPITHSHPGHPS